MLNYPFSINVPTKQSQLFSSYTEKQIKKITFLFKKAIIYFHLLFVLFVCLFVYNIQQKARLITLVQFVNKVYVRL